MMKAARLAAGLAILLLGACAPQASAPDAAPAPSAPVQAAFSLVQRPLQSPAAPCSETFVAHDLEHTTGTGRGPTRLFDSNGAGLAINDLDGDGRLDIVLANLSGASTLLWNDGGLTFTRAEVPAVFRTRGVATVDVDGDGLLDIVFTSGSTSPAWLRNVGDREFVHTSLPGVTLPAYAMNWADREGDNDLDLVTGAYDAGFVSESGPNSLFEAKAGINLYLQDDGAWKAQQLATDAETLAISVWDLNGDLRPDIWVGNDFDVPDMVWLQTETGVEPANPFPLTAHSTMGIERGDVNSDGWWDYFATDMKPYQRDVATVTRWLPLMEHSYQNRIWRSAQRSENALMVGQAGGGFRSDSYARRLDATGWSWSGKFGDLDNDGDLDSYVVNGMIAADLLDYLPGGEMVEENQALRNTGAGDFAVASEWGLGSTRSGRGMSMADLDGDGDLDIVVNNLNTAAQLFENQLCAAGEGLVVNLRSPGTHNLFSVGAAATLHTDTGDLLRDVRAGSGYLSGDPAQMHFGVPAAATIETLEIHWRDGAVSVVEGIAAGTEVTVTRMSALQQGSD